MTPDDASFTDCFSRLSEGDQRAARQIYERFVGQLVGIAARKLDRKLGAKADPESVAMSAFESFFERHQAGTFQVQNWGMVFGLLSHITMRKALNRNRFHRQQRRNDEGIVSFEDWQAVSSGPSPEDEAMVSDLLERAISQFDGDERTIIEAFMAGESTAAVAKRVNFTVRTVQRTVAKFDSRLQELRTQE